jgi:hypothetical protein
MHPFSLSSYAEDVGIVEREIAQDQLLFSSPYIGGNLSQIAYALNIHVRRKGHLDPVSQDLRRYLLHAGFTQKCIQDVPVDFVVVGKEEQHGSLPGPDPLSGMPR